MKKIVDVDPGVKLDSAVMSGRYDVLIFVRETAGHPENKAVFDLDNYEEYCRWVMGEFNEKERAHSYVELHEMGRTEEV